MMGSSPRIPIGYSATRNGHFQLEDQQVLDRVCSDEDLTMIATELQNWEMLCGHLYISGAEQTEIRRDYPGDYRLQKAQALKLWKRKAGRKATYRQLVEIFRKLVNNNFAEYVVGLAKALPVKDHCDPQCYSKPSIDDLMNIAPLIAPKWGLVGLKMDVPEAILTRISTENSNDIHRSATMLKIWLNGNDRATFNDLFQVLEVPFVGLKDVSEKIKAQLCTFSMGPKSLTSPVKLTDSAKKFACLLVDIIDILPPDCWKKMRNALEFYVDPSSGIYPGEVDPAVYENVSSVPKMLTSLKNYQLLTPVELGWLKFLVDDVVKCPEATQRIKEYEASSANDPLLGNVHFSAIQQPSEGTALLSCRSDIQPETATCCNLKLAKAGCTSYVGIAEHEAVFQSVSVGSLICYWRIPYKKAIEIKLSKSVSVAVKSALERAKITHVSVMVADRCDTMSVDDLTLPATVDLDTQHKTFLSSPVPMLKRKLSDSRKFWLALRRKDTSLSYQVEFYENRRSAIRGSNAFQTLSFSDITEVRLSKNQKNTIEILCSNIGYSIGLNSDTEAEKLLADLQHLLSSHQELCHYALSKSHQGSVGKLLQKDGRCVSPDSLVRLKFYDSVFGHLKEQPPELLNCVIKCTLSQVPTAKLSESSPVARRRSSTKPTRLVYQMAITHSLDEWSSPKLSGCETTRRAHTFSASASCGYKYHVK